MVPLESFSANVTARIAYVTVFRAETHATIYTDDRERLVMSSMAATARRSARSTRHLPVTVVPGLSSPTTVVAQGSSYPLKMALLYLTYPRLEPFPCAAEGKH